MYLVSNGEQISTKELVQIRGKKSTMFIGIEKVKQNHETSPLLKVSWLIKYSLKHHIYVYINGFFLQSLQRGYTLNFLFT